MKKITRKEFINDLYEVCSLLKTKIKRYEGCEIEDEELYFDFSVFKDACQYSHFLRMFDSLSGYRRAAGEFEYELGGGLQYFKDKAKEVI